MSWFRFSMKYDGRRKVNRSAFSWIRCSIASLDSRQFTPSGRSAPPTELWT